MKEQELMLIVITLETGLVTPIVLIFANNSPDLANDTDHSEESDMCVGFKWTVRNPQQTSKYNSKRRPPFVVNTHPEN